MREDPVDSTVAIADDAELIDALPETLFDSIVSLAAQALKAPIGYFSVVDGDRVWYKGRHGWTIDALPVEESLSATTVSLNRPVFIPDVAANGSPDYLGSLPRNSRIRFYAGVPIHTAGGKAIGALSVVDSNPRTITRDEAQMLEGFGRDLEQRLDLAIAELKHERFHDERAILINMALHDARGILGTLKWSLDSLEESMNPVPPALAHSQQLAAELTKLCGSISGDGLAAAELTVDAVPQNLRLWFDWLMQRAIRIAGRAGLAVAVVNQLPEGPIPLDVHLVERVLMNLIRNACAASGGIGTKIEIAARPAGGSAIEFTVADDGPGIPDEIRGRIFEPYFSKRAKGNGSGLGLAFAKLAANTLGGSIEFSPRLPSGARFRFVVPVGVPIRIDG